MAKPKDASDTDVITVDLQPFIMPGAMVLSSIILAGGLIIGTNNIAGSLKGGSTTTTNTANTNNDTVAQDTTGDTQDVSGSTSLDDDPIQGNRDTAKVALVEFSDYECPFCQRHFQQTYPEIKKNYVDTGKIVLVFRDFPLSFHEPAASREANSANCVKKLAGDEKYWQMHDYLYTNTASNGAGIEQSRISDYAVQLGVDKSSFDSCVSNAEFADEIAQDTVDGTSAGVQGTPGFIIGVLGADGSVTGEVVSGAQPYSVFEQAIENQLAKAS